MGQSESLVEADESQTDVEQGRSFTARPRLSAARSSVERRRLSRPLKRYSTSSNESALEALLRQRRPSLHRKSTGYLSEEGGFKYPHPLYVKSLPRQQQQKSANSSPTAATQNRRGPRHAISSSPKPHKSKSPVTQAENNSGGYIVAKNTNTNTPLKDAVQKQLLPIGKEPLDFKHCDDPTFRQYLVVDTTKESRTADSSEHHGSTPRSIGGEIDKTFAFLNSTDPDVTRDPEDSEINFNPEEFSTLTSTPKNKRKEESSNSDNKLDSSTMDFFRSGDHRSRAAAASRGYSVTSDSAGTSGFYQAGAKRSSSAHRGASSAAAAAASSSKTSRKTSSSQSNKRRSKSESRARSDSSISDMSAASKSSMSSNAKKAKEENKKRIKERLTKTGQKGTITDKWQGVVNEFQNVKKHSKKDENKVTNKEQRKVSKIGNLEKYDNVKALFGKRLPLANQQQQQSSGGPSGVGRVRKVEGETASEGSTHSWTALTPVRRATNTDERKYSTRSYQQGVDAANRRGQSISSDRQLLTREGRMSNDRYNIKGSGAVANSSSNVAMGQNYKKGVKFQKKRGYHIEDEASIIVDDAIKRALGLFYGRRTSTSGSRMGASSRKQSSSASRKSSAASSSSSRLAEQRNRASRTNNYIRDIKTQNIYRESIVKDLRGQQRNMSIAGGGGVRKHSIRPIPGTGRRSEGHALPPPMKAPGSLAPGGFYELDITPYGGKDKEKEAQEEQQQQTQNRYPEGTPTRFHVGSSSPQPQTFSLPPIANGPASGQSIQTTTSHHDSSFQVNQDQVDISTTHQNFANGSQPFTDTNVKYAVNSPTISKGNVTRVLHELNEQTNVQPAQGQTLQSFRSMDNINQDYSTGTWPLTKNPSQTATQYETTNFTSNMAESIKFDTTGNYASLPGAMSMQHGYGMQQTPSLTANWDMYQSGPSHSYQRHTLSPENNYSIGLERNGVMNRLTQRQYFYPDQLDRPASTPAVLQGHNMYSPPPPLPTAAAPPPAGMYGSYATLPYTLSPGGYAHQRFYQTHYGSLGNLHHQYQHQQQQQPLDIHFQAEPSMYGTRRAQSYSNITSPTSPPIRNMQVQNMQNGYYGSTNDLLDYSAYSNEPIIVADLMERNPTVSNTMATQVGNQFHQRQSPAIQTNNQSRFYSNKGSSSPAVAMGKQQTLNFFVFGDKTQNDSKLRSANYDIEARQTRDDFDVSNYYYDRERQRQFDQVDYDDYDAFETRSEPDYSVNRWREQVIHHKQTQTLQPPKKKKPPVVKRIEKKEMQSYRQFPPKRPTPQVHHKETTHYITKERQIEKLPPDPPKRFSHSAQTDLSGTVVNKPKQRPKVQKYSSSTQYEKPPSPPRKKDTRVEVTQRVFAPRVTETRDFFKETIQPEEREEIYGTEVPITLKPSPEDNVISIIDSFNQPSSTTVVQKSSMREVARPDDDSEDSEMELIETIEIEEKEQRLSMAIFEEVEFTFERTKDGKTESHSGKGSDLLPFQFPGKYEATVDRRKQKCIQLRECTKGGSHKYEYDANVNRHLPAPNYQSAIDMKRDGDFFDGNNMDELVQRTQGIHLQNRNHNNHDDNSHQRSGSSSSQQVSSSMIHGGHPGGMSNRHIRVIERSQTATGGAPSNSSGYSSSDTTSSTAHHSHSISAGGPFEMPVHDESDEDQTDELRVFTSELKDITLTPPDQLSPAQEDQHSPRSSRYVSRFDPENVYFTVPEWTATNNEIYNFEKSGKNVSGGIRKMFRGNDNDSLPESLPEISSSPDIPDGKKKVNRKRDEQADAPKLRTRVVQDEHGNLMKITEVEKTVTKTEEFTEDDEAVARKMSASSEQLKDSEYMVMNVDEITEGQRIVEAVDDDSSEDEASREFRNVIPEVLGETTVTHVPVEYDEQTTSLGLKDEVDHNFDEQKFLYDMKTATLKPSVTKDNRSGAMLMQYGYNDMLTEL